MEAFSNTFLTLFPIEKEADLFIMFLNNILTLLLLIAESQ
jgi:hypothetical protein